MELLFDENEMNDYGNVTETHKFIAKSGGARKKGGKKDKKEGNLFPSRLKTFRNSS